MCSQRYSRSVVFVSDTSTTDPQLFRGQRHVYKRRWTQELNCEFYSLDLDL